MSFTVPSSWDELTQEQLRYVLRLLRLYSGRPDGQERIKMATLLWFCGFKVYGRVDAGWLCRMRRDKRVFILAPSLLPDLLRSVDWVTRPEEMTVRIERMGRYHALDFELHDLTFGRYIEADNYYQSFLLTHDSNCLRELAIRLYDIPDDASVPLMREEELMGCFLWFAAAKNVLARWFPHFLKPASSEESLSQTMLADNARAQIRLLTKGDVTKQDYIMNNTDTWTALAELDAQAKEAEEIERRYGKK